MRILVQFCVSDDFSEFVVDEFVNLLQMNGLDPTAVFDECVCCGEFRPCDSCVA